MSKKCWEKASRSTCLNCWATWFSVKLRPFLASSECEELEMVQFDPICLHVSKKHVTKQEIDSKRILALLFSRIMRFKPDYVHPFMNIDVSVVPDSVLASVPNLNTHYSVYSYTLMSSGRWFIFLLSPLVQIKGWFHSNPSAKGWRWQSFILFHLEPGAWLSQLGVRSNPFLRSGWTTLNWMSLGARLWDDAWGDVWMWGVG